MTPRILDDHDLDAVAAGKFRGDPNEYEDFAINRALLSTDFEGSVTIRMQWQVHSGITLDAED